MKQILVYLTTILIVIVGISMYENSVIRKQLQTAENNQSVLLDSVHKYKVQDSLNAVSISALMLSNGELKKYRAEDKQIIDKLKAEKSTLQQYIKHSTVTNVEVKAVVKDSIIHVRDTILCAKAFEYKSKWTDVNGYLLNDSAYLKIANRESLIISQSRVKKKFWFIKLPVWLFGYKTEKIDVISLNPNTQITDIEFIKIK